MTELRKLHDPASGPLRVAGFMSGSGTNLRRILERQRQLASGRGRSSFEVAAIFSDNAASAAPSIGKDFDLPVMVRDIAAWYRARGKPRRDMGLRAQYDAETLRALDPYGVSAAALAGYMSIVSPVLIGKLLAVNVHPADLTVMQGARRKFTGDRAVADAIRAGERFLRSTTHIVEAGVDEGRLLLVSRPVPVATPAGRDPASDLDEIARLNQETLKREGDWVVFPLSLQLIAEGRFSADGEGTLHFDGRPVPSGVRVEEID